MKRLSVACLLLPLVVAGSGCSTVTSANPGLTAATGEAWYTRDHSFFFISIGSDVYYCPKGGMTCYRARVQ
jgi:hypothetical protein